MSYTQPGPNYDPDPDVVGDEGILDIDARPDTSAPPLPWQDNQDSMPGIAAIPTQSEGGAINQFEGETDAALWQEPGPRNISQPADIVTSDGVSAVAIVALLKQIRDILGGSNVDEEFVWGGDAVRVLTNYPAKGRRRTMLVARAFGQANFTLIAAAAPVDLFYVNPARNGLSVINSGSNPCYIYLSRAGDALSGATPTLWLQAGGWWDGRMSRKLWCGNVSANSILGTVLTLGAI